MNFSEKLIALRKGRGWSQEDLAEQLDVSRQSVSKWESSASLPDLDKIIRLSDIFGVTTDYLLREDDAVEAAPVTDASATEPDVRNVSETEANTYLALTEEEAPRFGRAVMTCVLSPAPLLALMAAKAFHPALNEDALGCIGVVILLTMVALAVRTFIVGSLRLNPYEYMEKEPLRISAALQSDIKARKFAFQSEFTAILVRGVTLCILSAVPLLLAAGFDLHDGSILLTVCLLLVLVAIATCGFVRAGMIQESYDKLLQTGDYTPQAKRNAPIAGIYWCIVTAIYLATSFITMDWGHTWIIWPVAGVLFGVVSALQQVFAKRR